ncbi:unnamed protein product [Wuchereria bancrofti]|uniref:Uncharacterized protein n=1 Tax=Wuchereria bancrofti TaxID=6293 RepID=A0A3P7ED42_WUCBA|nr:unnamed protein product [Wuchereria bancrofti]
MLKYGMLLYVRLINRFFIRTVSLCKGTAHSTSDIDNLDIVSGITRSWMLILLVKGT